MDTTMQCVDGGRVSAMETGNEKKNAGYKSFLGLLFYFYCGIMRGGVLFGRGGRRGTYEWNGWSWELGKDYF